MSLIFSALSALPRQGGRFGLATLHALAHTSPATKVLKTPDPVRFYYAKSGTPTGTLFVCLGGYTASALWHCFWLFNQASPFNLGPLGEILLAERSHSADFTFEAEAKAVADEIRRKRPQRIVFIGHSMGGAIACLVIKELEDDPAMKAALQAGAVFMLSSPYERADLKVPVELYAWWVWPRIFNGLLYATYVRATGRRGNRSPSRAQTAAMRRLALACDRHMNGLENPARRAQLRALCNLQGPPPGSLSDYQLVYLRAECDPLVVPDAAQKYLEAFSAPPSRVVMVANGWHADLANQPWSWGVPIISRVRRLCSEPT